MIAILLAVVAADPGTLTVRTERLAVPKDVPAAVAATLQDSAIAVHVAGKSFATVWLRQEIPARAKGTDLGAIEPGALLGVIRWERPWSDFRGTEVPAGTYALRFVLQPASKDHEGTSPHREFGVLIAIADEKGAEAVRPRTAIERSGKIVGGTHPVVVPVLPVPKAPTEPHVLAKGKAIAFRVKLKQADGTVERPMALGLRGMWTD